MHFVTVGVPRRTLSLIDHGDCRGSRSRDEYQTLDRRPYELNHETPVQCGTIRAPERNEHHCKYASSDEDAAEQYSKPHTANPGMGSLRSKPGP
jgi:hypothetical protein